MLAGTLNKRFLFGAFVLAGYLGNNALVPALRVAWSQSEADADIIAAFWAGIRCCPVAATDFLIELIEAWSRRGDEDRASIEDLLAFNVVREDTDNEVLEALFANARANAIIRNRVAWVVQRVDTPTAVCFVSEVLGEIEGRSNGFTDWSRHFRDVWDLHSETVIKPKRMSIESHDALRSLWLNTKADADVRAAAFETWVRAAMNYQQLRLIVDNARWQDTLYWRRAELGDLEVIDIVRNKLPEKPGLLHLVPTIWHPSFIPILDEKLAKLCDKTTADYSLGTNGHYELTKILRDIPLIFSEPLLKKHWAFLQFSPRFIHLALYLCTPDTVRMATDSISRCEDKKKLFNSMAIRFGFMTEDLREKITLSHLEILKQWLPIYSNLDLGIMAEFCCRMGFIKWAEENLKPECDRRLGEASVAETAEAQADSSRIGELFSTAQAGSGRIGELFPTGEELLEELDTILAKERSSQFGAIRAWIDNFSKRPIRQETLWAALDAWFQQSPTTERLSIVAQAIGLAGDRRHLLFLGKYQIIGDQAEVDRLIANATFIVKSRTLN